MTASITGSLAVVITILSSRDPNVKNNYLMLNLAVSDLLLGKKDGLLREKLLKELNVPCHIFVQLAWAAPPP